MKKIQFIIAIVIMALVSACNIFNEEPVVVEPIVPEVEIDTVIPEPLPVRMHESVYLLEEIDDKYLIVIGSFESVEYALVHAEKYSNYGLDTRVIQKQDGFFMVSARAYESKDVAFQELKGIRNKYVKKSWVFTNSRMVDQYSI